MSAGTNNLLKQGATPVTAAADVLEVLGPLAGHAAQQPTARHVPKLGTDEALVWEALGAEPRHVDELARTLDLRPGETSATLAMLELKGLARQVGSMLYTRA
jgi:DNA processing protein